MLKGIVSDKKNREITAKLLLIFGGVFAVFFIAWLFLFMRDPSGSQRAVFFTDSNDFFMDWFNVVYYSIGKKPYVWGLTEERSLPPLTFLLLYPFSKLYDYDVTGWVENETRYTARFTQLPMVAALAVFLVSYILLFYAMYKMSCRGRSLGGDLKRAFLFLILFLSGVNLYCLDRGNLQVITAAAVFLYIYLCDREGPSPRLDGTEAVGSKSGTVENVGACGCTPEWVKSFAGVFCLAFAAALKIFPAVMGVLLLYRKKWKEAAAVFLLGAALFIFPFFWMETPFIDCVSAFISTLGEHARSYMTIAEFGFSTPVIISLTGLNHGILQGLAYIFAVISLCTAWSLKGWKRIMLLMLMLVMTSGQQGYYCLMFLFLPMVMFFTEEHSWIDIIYVLMFAFILSPLQRTAHVGAVEVPARALINAVLIVLYVWLIIESAGNIIRLRKADKERDEQSQNA